MAFFKDELTSATYAKAEVAAGEVPVTKGASSLFTGQPLATYDTTIYNSVTERPELPVLLGPGDDPAGGDDDADDLAQVFELSETPQKFESLLNKPGQVRLMTQGAPPGP